MSRKIIKKLSPGNFAPMTELEVIKAELIIAKFNGDEIFDTDENGRKMQKGVFYIKHNGRRYAEDMLEYHKSWDNWMEPVVEKIQELGENTWVKYLNNRCEIEVRLHSWKQRDIDFTADNGNKHNTKIQNTLLSVVEVIEWYNEFIKEHPTYINKNLCK